MWARKRMRTTKIFRSQRRDVFDDVIRTSARWDPLEFSKSRQFSKYASLAAHHRARLVIFQFGRVDDTTVKRTRERNRAGIVVANNSEKSTSIDRKSPAILINRSSCCAQELLCLLQTTRTLRAPRVGWNSSSNDAVEGRLEATTVAVLLFPSSSIFKRRRQPVHQAWNFRNCPWQEKKTLRLVAVVLLLYPGIRRQGRLGRLAKCDPTTTLQWRIAASRSRQHRATTTTRSCWYGI